MVVLSKQEQLQEAIVSAANKVHRREQESQV